MQKHLLTIRKAPESRTAVQAATSEAVDTRHAKIKTHINWCMPHLAVLQQRRAACNDGKATRRRQLISAMHAPVPAAGPRYARIRDPSVRHHREIGVILA